MTSITIQAVQSLRRLVSRPILTMAIVLLTATTARAATYYVATDGNDNNPGTISEPFRTIKKGAWSLSSGDTLYIRGGVYDEIIESWDVPAGSSGQHTVIAGYQDENPIVRCSNCSGILVTLGQYYLTASGFTIDAINTGGGGTCAYLGDNVLFERMTCLNAARDGLHVAGANTIVRDSHIKDCGRIQENVEDTKGLGIHANSNGASNTSNLLIEGNLIEGCRAGGIGVQQAPGSDGVVVRNNILRNFGTRSTWPQWSGGVPQAGTGINFAHGSNFYAYNNVIYGVRGAASDCFLAWGGGQGRPGGGNYYFYNNTCHDTDTGLVVWDEVSNVTAVNNIFSNVDRVDNLGNGGGHSNTNYITNPIFVNAAAGDFRLSAGSPGIGEGVNLSPVVVTDIDGASRGSYYDIGAYQYGGETPSESVPDAPSGLTFAP